MDGSCETQVVDNVMGVCEVEFCDNDQVDDGEDEDLMLRMIVVMSVVPKPGNF